MDAILEMIKAGAAAPATSYALKGRLILSKTGWIILTVPNNLMRGAFAAINEPGISLPTSEATGRPDAHVTVMRPEELKQIGGAGRIDERGH